MLPGPFVALASILILGQLVAGYTPNDIKNGVVKIGAGCQWFGRALLCGYGELGGVIECGGGGAFYGISAAKNDEPDFGLKPYPPYRDFYTTDDFGSQCFFGDKSYCCPIAQYSFPCDIQSVTLRQKDTENPATYDYDWLDQVPACDNGGSLVELERTGTTDGPGVWIHTINRHCCVAA